MRSVHERLFEGVVEGGLPRALPDPSGGRRRPDGHPGVRPVRRVHSRLSSLALSRDTNGIVQIDRKKCTSCLMCVEFCPSASMYFSARIPSPYKCVACGICVRACPEGALEIIDTGKEG